MNPLPLIRRWWSAQFVRVAVWSALGLAGIIGGVALAYELALARVPQHRARLERLVRSHTGLDVRFNELNLRWGWYGPEAVFQHVELGEPGRSNVLVRAPQLIVGFDAWRSVQSGQLQAGRITFVAPDINLERRQQEGTAHGRQTRDSAMENRTRLLQRWRGGRIELEGGTLRLPDPRGSAAPLALQLRRASLRRSADQWSASALIFLPERLGHTARFALQLEGDLTRPRDLRGSARFDGMRLAFAGWRQIFGSDLGLMRALPTNGNGDLMVRVAFHHGTVDKADGRVRAQDVTFVGAPWFMSAQSEPETRAQRLDLPRLRGDWRLAHRDRIWQLRIDDLDLGSKDDGDLTPAVSVDVAEGRRSVRGQIGPVPLESVLSLISWLAPGIDLGGAELRGIARGLRFDWNAARPEGSRLQASARAEDVSIAPSSKRIIADGLKGRLDANEDGLDITVDSDRARIALENSDVEPLDNLRIASELRLSRRQDGWHLNTPLFTIDHGSTQLILSGSLTKTQALESPLVDIRATLVRASVSLLRDWLREDLTSQFGAVAQHLASGRVERAQFQLQTSADGSKTFAGTLAVRDGQIAAGDLWPEVQGLDARIEWTGPRIEATVERGRSGSIELESAQARWETGGRTPPHIAGQVRGRLEDALQWLMANPKIEEYAPRLREFSASGDALLSFDVTLGLSRAAGVSNASNRSAREPRVRVAALLDSAELQLTQDLPPIEGVRGSLGFDAGKLQRSTLTGRWLGGPVTLRVSERREQNVSLLSIQAQGLLDARQLVALAGFDPLPEVEGETPWSGELSYQPEDSGRAARWQLDADASMVGVSSRLPEPFAKAVVTAVPLRVDATGTGIEAEVNITLGNRLRSQLALSRLRQESDLARSRWHVDRGAVNLGGGSINVPSEPLIAVHGEVDRFDFPAYAALWQRAGNFTNVPAIAADLIAQQLWLAGRSFPGVRIQARKAAGSPAELNLESEELNGSVRYPAHHAEVRLTAQNLDADERARIVTQLKDAWSDSVVTVN
jgi:uncharacterized protein YhdP